LYIKKSRRVAIHDTTRNFGDKSHSKQGLVGER